MFSEMKQYEPMNPYGNRNRNRQCATVQGSIVLLTKFHVEQNNPTPGVMRQSAAATALTPFTPQELQIG
jgi:hypothetical protein